MKRIIIALLFTISTISLYTQSYNSNFNQFEVKTHYGFTIPHHSYMSYLLKSNIIIGEINYSIKTDGTKSWQHTWRFPELGIGYLMGGLGNINVFGFSQSIFFFYGVPIVETERILFKYRLGTGVAFISEKFDRRANYYNIAIGSYLNAHLHFSLLIDYKPFEIPLYFSAGFAFNHFSSGAIETPNLGLNQITTNFGLKYLYSAYNYSLPKRTIPYLYNKELELSCYYAASFKENSTYENKKYFINSVVFDIASRVTTKRSLGAGINIIADPSIKPLMMTDYNGIHNIFRIGIHAVQELYFTDDLSMIIHLGTYVFNYYKENEKFLVYSKIGVRYSFADRFFANVLLKTHTTTADYIEFGVGMRLIDNSSFGY
ncbi:MAG TPA: acyloxyacyl hydrolase [Bacteroidales bacterium]|nr:acyloxyacyl hydrolase [Bacteroidales bacterium]